MKYELKKQKERLAKFEKIVGDVLKNMDKLVEALRGNSFSGSALLIIIIEAQGSRV